MGANALGQDALQATPDNQSLVNVISDSCGRLIIVGASSGTTHVSGSTSISIDGNVGVIQLTSPWQIQGTISVSTTSPIALIPASASTITTVSATTTATAVAANSARLGLTAYVSSTSGPVNLAYSTGGSATSYTVQLVASQYWEMPDPVFTGGMSIVMPSTGTTALVNVTELS